MRHENPQERSQQQTASPPEIRTAPPLAGKRVLTILAIGFVIILIAVSPYLIKAARVEFERIIQSKNAPLPVPPAKISQHATEGLSAMAPPQQVTPSAEEQAQQLWTAFEKTGWGAPLEAWSGLHPEISCKPFRGDMWGGGADAQWSHRCSTGPQPEAAHWSFYVFGLQEPLVPRLGQFDVFTGALPAETLTAVQNLLQNRLTTRFGPGEDRSPKFARALVVPWPEYMRWKAVDVEIQLNLNEFDPQRKEGRLRLQGRHRALLEALNEDERLKLVGTSGFLYEVGSGMDAQLADNLRTDFPDVATMLMKQRPDPDPQKMREAVQQWQSQLKSAQTAGQTGIRAAVIALPQTNWKAEDFHDALVRLLTSVKISPPNRQPVLLLAADRLAWRLPWVLTNDKSQDGHWLEWRTQLAGLGVTYKESVASPAENSWTYTGDLLKRVWMDYRETDWGERAFLLLLSHGWDTGVDCAAGNDQFRTVIQQGLQFQEKHPNSRYRPDVQLAVAQAYETWWSLSQAPTGEEYSDVEPGKYQEGADVARQKSIANYEQLLQSSPQSDHAAYARRVLPRLKLGLDTGQRRFYCTIGD